MKILMTGGAGFIGSHIVEALLERGHTVDVVDNLSTGSVDNIPEGAEFYHCAFDDPKVKRLLQKKYDIINHHAAQIDLRKSVTNPVTDLKNDVVASVTLFKWAVESGVQYIIFASSGGAIYGEQSGSAEPADENHPINPASPYGLNKWIIERYLNYFHIQYGIRYCALRYANVYGPRQNPLSEAGVIAIFTNRMLRKEETIINGSGEQTRDFVYISDVVDSNLSAIKLRYHGEINIGTGKETSVNTIFTMLKEMTKSTTNEKHGPPKEGEQFRSVLSCEKAKNELHWSPEVSLTEGLKKTVEFEINKL